MSTLQVSPRLEAWDEVIKKGAVPTHEAMPLSEVEAWRADDLRAGKIICLVMNAIFLAALILYGSIAIAVAMGGQP